MTSQDHDTDPSTPGAKRFSEPRTAAASVALVDGADPAARARPARSDAPPPASGPRSSREGTDPGLAPPPGGARSPSGRPMAVVVPPPAPAHRDSVDVLLEGIRREPSDRPRTTAAQTDGQAAAAYHAEHAVRAARSALDDEPKVVIDSPPLAQTIRIGRLPSGDPPPPKPWGETTAASRRPLFGRVLVAVAAGLAVVAAIFAALRWSGERAAAKATSVTSASRSAPPESAQVPAAPAAAAAPVLLAPPAARPAASDEPASTPVEPASARRAAAPAKAPAKAHKAAAKSKAGDLGEFKTSF